MSSKYFPIHVLYATFYVIFEFRKKGRPSTFEFQHTDISVFLFLSNLKCKKSGLKKTKPLMQTFFTFASTFVHF